MSVADVSETALSSTVSKSLWIPGTPLGEASLIVVSNSPRETLSLRLFDSDGAVANTLNLELSKFPAVVSLEMLVAGVKRDSGFRHGQMQIQHSSTASVTVHMHSNASAVALPPTTELAPGANFFMPVSFGANKTPLLTLVNGGENEAVVKLRLFCGNRMPELMVSIPPRGSRVVALGTEFSEYTAFSADKEVHGYVRLHLKSEGSVGVSFLEVNGSAAAEAIFSVVR
jgi:hypothetical protein